MLKITDYEILREVKTGFDSFRTLPRGTPLMVMSLLDEESFLKDQIVHHHQNVIIDDEMHDWKVEGDRLYYYSRLGRVLDIVLVYGVQQVDPPMNFCPMTGKKLVA